MKDILVPLAIAGAFVWVVFLIWQDPANTHADEFIVATSICEPNDGVDVYLDHWLNYYGAVRCNNGAEFDSLDVYLHAKKLGLVK